MHYSICTMPKVPGSYASVQAAINTAADGDTVLVDPGTSFLYAGRRRREMVS